VSLLPATCLNQDRCLQYMFRKFLLPIFSFFIISCASTKEQSNILFDQKFEKCTDEKYDYLANQSFPIETLLFQKKNIHNLLENELIKEGYLEEISKKGYIKLLNTNIDPEFFEKFESEIGFNPDLLFPTLQFISCYGILYHRLNLFKENSWQFNFGKGFNEYEAYGKMNIKSPYLEKALEEIPDEKFKNLIYRKLFLDLLYNYYEQHIQ